MRNLILLAAFGATLAATASASAEGKRENSLRKDVAVRHRRLLVKNRFELTPLFESTINADFKHIVGGGAKLEYHLSDMWSFGVVGVASTAINTKLVDKFEPLDRTMYPTASTAADHADSQFINNIMFQIGVGCWVPPSFEYTTFR